MALGFWRDCAEFIDWGLGDYWHQMLSLQIYEDLEEDGISFHLFTSSLIPFNSVFRRHVYKSFITLVPSFLLLLLMQL